MTIFAVCCPNCETETPLSTKRKEVLNEVKAECPSCGWLDLASKGIIKEKDFANWF